MSLSPLVGVLGHRQVGKTTFIETHSKAYYVVDTLTESKEAQQDPFIYLTKRAGKAVALDECQAVPELFPELKEWVRTHKSPGQFILSGSVRFTSREAIKESLTGRIINLELMPMTIPEQDELPLSDTLIKIINSNNLSRFSLDHPIQEARFKKIQKRIWQYSLQGGLPGICFLRDQKQRELKLGEQLKTILGRDIQMVKKLNIPYGDILELVSHLAGQQGVPIDYTFLKKVSGISTPSIKKIIDSLEAVFLVRRVLIEGSTQGFILYFEDMGEHQYLSKKKPTLQNTFEHLCYTHLRTQFAYKIGESAKVFQFRTRGGALIPFAFAHREGTVGVLPLIDISEISAHSGSIKSFLAAYENSKILILHPGSKRDYQSNQNRVLIAPVGAVF